VRQAQVSREEGVYAPSDRLIRLTRVAASIKLPQENRRHPGSPLVEPIETKRRLVAIFAADVEGYSRLMGSDEVATLDALTARREVLDGLIANHGGRIANTAGDSVLAEFGSAVDAVRCAMAAQGALAQANSMLPENRHINFRMGLHVGDVMVRAGDLFGDGVNIAARLQALAKAGGLCISGVTYDQVRKILPLSFTDLGAQTVKNIEEPIRAYEVKVQGEVEPSSLGDGRPLALPDRPSIAVLPFQNMSGDPEQEYFADGMVEEIITALSRFKSLFVIARNSSFTYKGKAVDIKRVGRELGVRYVLEGSIRRAGQRARITGQLIDAESGSHLWADRFEGALDDIFELQDNVARSVVGAIASRLIDASETVAARKAPERWDTYDHYFRALSYVYKFDLASTVESKRIFQAAIETDPAFALGYAGIARAILNIRHVHNQPISDGELTQALEFADRAVELSPEDEVVLTCAAYVVGLLGGNPERGHELAKRATALNVNSAQAWNARGTVELVLGESEAALEAFANVMRLNPLDKRSVPFALFGTAAALLLLGRPKDGAAAARRMLLSFRNDIRGLFILIGNVFLDGEMEETESLIESFKRLFPHVRSSDLRQTYRVRKREHMETIERIIARIGLPE
jgi:adenylate cyclase